MYYMVACIYFPSRLAVRLGYVTQHQQVHLCPVRASAQRSLMSARGHSSDLALLRSLAMLRTNGLTIYFRKVI